MVDGSFEVTDAYIEPETVFIPDNKEATEIHKAYTKGFLWEDGMIWGQKILR